MRGNGTAAVVPGATHATEINVLRHFHQLPVAVFQLHFHPAHTTAVAQIGIGLTKFVVHKQVAVLAGPIDGNIRQKILLALGGENLTIRPHHRIAVFGKQYVHHRTLRYHQILVIKRIGHRLEQRLLSRCLFRLDGIGLTGITTGGKYTNQAGRQQQVLHISGFCLKLSIRQAEPAHSRCSLH